VDLLAITHDVADRMSARADVAEVDLEVAGQSTVVEGFPHILGDLVSNLCSNAIRYNRPGGSVRMWVGERDGHPVVEVADTGIGIPAEEAEHIFEEFVQLNHYYDGTGIGLTVARSLARRLGGDIVLDTSYQPGARFVMTLPL
jgi:signal transduction histidine kinase